MLGRASERGHDPHEPAGGDWRQRAACRGVDPEVFFPTAETGPARAAQVGAAKRVCSGCPVIEACRLWAVDALAAGVAGGLDEDERRALRAGQPVRAERRVEPPVGGNRREFAAAGRRAVASGESVASVARRFGVDERTAYHWRATATTTTAPASSAAPGGAR